MRAQEKKWPTRKQESRKAYLKRLRRTAMSTPSAYIDKIIGDLANRTQLLKRAKGGYFREGGD